MCIALGLLLKVSRLLFTHYSKSPHLVQKTHLEWKSGFLPKNAYITVWSSEIVAPYVL